MVVVSTRDALGSSRTTPRRGARCRLQRGEAGFARVRESSCVLRFDASGGLSGGVLGHTAAHRRRFGVQCPAHVVRSPGQVQRGRRGPWGERRLGRRMLDGDVPMRQRPRPDVLPRDDRSRGLRRRLLRSSGPHVSLRVLRGPLRVRGHGAGVLHGHPRLGVD